MNHSRFYKYANRSKVGLRSTVKNEQNSQENEPVPPGIQNGAEQKVHIFFNDTGHGKTYYLTWLAWRLAALDRSLYVIKLIGKDCSTYFKRLEESNIQNLNDTEIVRLLFSYIHLASSAPNGNRDEYVPCAKLLTVANGKIVLNKAKEKELPTEELIKLRVFREKFNLQKLVLILDGFDEIVPCCKDAVISRGYDHYTCLVDLTGLKVISRTPSTIVNCTS
uniref:NACHT domain-containing protein n=1 Tax=Anopheles maculatus TaxID=74869 RepID=A0A182SZ76_9DIPT